MKKSIKLSALFLLFSTSIFAATPVRKGNGPDIKSSISVNGLQSNIGVTVNVVENLSQQPYVRISDMDGHALCTDKISNHVGSRKAYNLSQLDNGDYIITIIANKQQLKKQVHIYDEYGKKTYFIMQ